jgi:hypothetical protein
MSIKHSTSKDSAVRTISPAELAQTTTLELLDEKHECPLLPPPGQLTKEHDALGFHVEESEVDNPRTFDQPIYSSMFKVLGMLCSSYGFVVLYRQLRRHQVGSPLKQYLASISSKDLRAMLT